MTEGGAMMPLQPHDTGRLPLRREIAAIGAEMAQRLREALAGGDYEVQDIFALGNSDVSISINPTGADIGICDCDGRPRRLPNIEEALRSALPDYGETEDGLRAEREEAEAERLHYRNLCQVNGWPVCW